MDLSVGFMATTVPVGPEDARPRFVLDLAQALTELGCRVEVLTPHIPGAPIKERVGGVQIERFRYWWPERSQRIFGHGGALRNIRGRPLTALQIPPAILAQATHAHRLANARRYDILHAHWLVPSGLAVALTGRRFVASVLGSDVLLLNSALANWAKRFVLGRAAAVAASSRTLADKVESIRPGTAVEVVPMGIPTRRKVNQANAAGLRERFGSPLVVMVARLAREKGADILLRALVSAPDVCAVIAGEGPERQALEEHAIRLGLSGRVSFPGWVASSQVLDLMAAGDVVVVPSRSEGQGLTAPEAMSAGTPVVASRIHGLAETVSHERDGLLVPPDDPESLANAVRRILNDPALASKLVEGGRARARNFSMDGTARKIMAIYERVLDASEGAN